MRVIKKHVLRLINVTFLSLPFLPDQERNMSDITRQYIAYRNINQMPIKNLLPIIPYPHQTGCRISDTSAGPEPELRVVPSKWNRWPAGRHPVAAIRDPQSI